MELPAVGVAGEGVAGVEDVVVVVRAGQDQFCQVGGAAVFPGVEVVDVTSPVGGGAAGYFAGASRSGE